MRTPKLLLIDNYDSFTYNLVQAFLVLGAEVDVYRNDALSVADALKGDHTHLVISPGPGTPHDAGGTDPFVLNRDFVTQVWAPDFAALARGRETAFYRDHLQHDEDNFVDQATVVFMPVRERELLAQGGLVAAPDGYALTDAGTATLADLGFDANALRAGPAHRIAYPCLDWSERRDHLAGKLASGLLSHFIERGWLRRIGSERALALTPPGRQALARLVSID